MRALPGRVKTGAQSPTFTESERTKNLGRSWRSDYDTGASEVHDPAVGIVGLPEALRRDAQGGEVGAGHAKVYSRVMRIDS